jgi:nucleotide-binding universal stress UspA family protein
MELFRTILIPVDFSVNTEVAVCKAIEISDAKDVMIYLVHVYKPSMFQARFEKASIAEKQIDAALRLKEWKQHIKEHLPLAKVHGEVETNDSVEQGIIKRCVELKPDLVVIGKKSNHAHLPMLNTVTPSAISKQTKCAVLTVKPGCLHNKIKNVVVPVNDEVPQMKIDAIASLCKKNRVKVYLVTFVNGDHVPEEFSASSLLKVYQWLKTLLHCQVEYAVLHGRNKARAILSFAEKNRADILLLSPDSETRIGWPGKHISDVIPPASKVQVLTVGGAVHSFT